LAERLQRAEQALAKLKVLSEGDLAKVTEQSQALLNRHDVAAYLQVTWTATRRRLNTISSAADMVPTARLKW
jgi:hypothetical protein